MIWLVGLAFIVLMIAGVAVAYALGAASVLSFFATDNGKFLAILPQRMFSEIDVFALMAMPLFILTGEIMNRAGITKALIDLAMAMMGRIKGGLGHVNVLASVFLSGISGVLRKPDGATAAPVPLVRSTCTSCARTQKVSTPALADACSRAPSARS